MSSQPLIAKRYELLHLIGRGGAGQVYFAQDHVGNQPVAIKHLKPNSDRLHPDLIERFRREGQLLRQLNHPNIVGLIDVVEESGNHYLVMEYVAGGTLASLLKTQGQLSVEQTLKISLDVSDALTRAHRLGIVHRDLKPANILLDAQGFPRLCDFGVARWVFADDITGSGVLVGTFSYMSPEACGGDPIDIRSDIWSLGVVMYEMLTGRLPFTQNDIAKLIRQIMSETPPDIQALRPEVPDSLADLVYRMLQKDREERLPSVRLVGAELEAILHGRPLNTVTLGAAAQLQSWQDDSSMPSKDKLHNLPVVTAPLVGREQELEEAEQLLSEDLCRLLTLLGPGGVGKTRLALALAQREVDRFRHGVYIVDLVPLQQEAEIITAIADVLSFKFVGTANSTDDLLNFLRQRELLLVLDNFEHLIPFASLVAGFINAAPHVKFVITSRERLRLQDEWVLQLTGLPVSKQVVVTEAELGNAERLFLRSCRRIQPNFKPAAEDFAHIREICQRVDGLPLGIELAASWITLLTPAEIVAEIRQSMDFLSVHTPDLPARHHSLRAVTEYSLRLLNEEERRTLAALSVFRGSFTLRAARHIVETSLPTLNRLVDKSLVQRNLISGRFNLQEQLRRFTMEILPDWKTFPSQIQGRHADYYAVYLIQRDPGLEGGRQIEAIDEVEREMDNIRAAWKWAAEQSNWPFLDKVLDVLYHFYSLVWRWQEAEMAFSQAIQRFPQNQPPENVIHGRLMVRLASTKRFIGHREEAQKLLAQCLPFFRQQGNPRELAFTLYQFARINLASPNAESQLVEAQTLAQSAGDWNLLAEILNTLAQHAYQQGNPTASTRLVEEAISIRREHKDELGIARLLSNLGVIHISNREFEKAKESLTASLNLQQRLGYPLGAAICRVNLSDIAIKQGDYAAAERWAKEAISYLRDIGAMSAVGVSIVNLTEALFYLGRFKDAEVVCQEGLHLPQEIPSAGEIRVIAGHLALVREENNEARRYWQDALATSLNDEWLLKVLAGYGLMALKDGELENALRYLVFSANHEWSNPYFIQVAIERIAVLQQQLPTAVFSITTEETKGKPLADYVSELLDKR